MIRHLARSLPAAAMLLAMQPALAADKYVFDASHTEIEFVWDHLGFSTTSGHFDRFDGSVLFDEDELSEARVNVTIDTGSLDTNHARRDEHLRSDDFFHVERYPEAAFESTAIRAAGDGRYQVAGELSLHGEVQPVTLDVTINKIGMHPMSEAKTIGFDATTTISRSAFGMGKFTPAVGDEVTIRISAEMPRASDLAG